MSRPPPPPPSHKVSSSSSSSSSLHRTIHEYARNYSSSSSSSSSSSPSSSPRDHRSHIRDSLFAPDSSDSDLTQWSSSSAGGAMEMDLAAAYASELLDLEVDSRDDGPPLRRTVCNDRAGGEGGNDSDDNETFEFSYAKALANTTLWVTRAAVRRIQGVMGHLRPRTSFPAPARTHETMAVHARQSRMTREFPDDGSGL
ncbi:hypothetical protein HKX48_001640 [Thoreauomyces humboldtii]|nr:hypothetical protein HKX48_001640 [Thoreauomyces humboldtii]